MNNKTGALIMIAVISSSVAAATAIGLYLNRKIDISREQNDRHIDDILRRIDLRGGTDADASASASASTDTNGYISPDAQVNTKIEVDLDDRRSRDSRTGSTRLDAISALLKKHGIV